MVQSIILNLVASLEHNLEFESVILSIIVRMDTDLRCRSKGLQQLTTKTQR